MAKVGAGPTHRAGCGESVPVPDGVDAAGAETGIVNDVTAWQMLLGGQSVRDSWRILAHSGTLVSYG